MADYNGYSDARKTKQRIPRIQGICTSCGIKLPKSRRYWGLVWDNNNAGICATCLSRIRQEIGYNYYEP